MNPAWKPFCQLLGAYLLGAIPFAYLAGRLLRGIDIRQHGSGNVGATNVLRVLGKGPGAAVLALDIAKGWLATAWIPSLGAVSSMRAFFSESAADKAWWPCALGLAAVLGHSYTVFLGFKGGKGVATSAGVFLGLAPQATLVVFALFALAVSVTRMVSVGSLLGAAALPALVVGFKEWRPKAAPANMSALMAKDWSLQDRPVFWLALAIAVLVWVKHIPNMRRIAAGTESKVGGPKKEDA
jgi:glycerol-3-phosphate acyltransferase PlsY